MFIYSGALQAMPGKGAEAGALVAQVRDTMSAATGNQCVAWAVAAGGPVGSFAVSARVDGTAALIDFQQKAGASSDYVEAAGKLGALLAGPAETALVEVVGVAGEPGPPKPLTMVTVATIGANSPGGLSAAMGWSTQVLERASSVTGTSALLVTSSAGVMFQVGWIFGADDGDQMDEMNTKLAGDAEYMALLDAAGGLFLEGSAQRNLLMMMA
jgi:hypothetical protein